MKYRKKPEIVDAIQWTGHNFDECLKFCSFIRRAGSMTRGVRDLIAIADRCQPSKWITFAVGCWIIKDDKGKFCFRSDESFKLTYENIS